MVIAEEDEQLAILSARVQLLEPKVAQLRPRARKPILCDEALDQPSIIADRWNMRRRDGLDHRGWVPNWRGWRSEVW